MAKTKAYNLFDVFMAQVRYANGMQAHADDMEYNLSEQVPSMEAALVRLRDRRDIANHKIPVSEGAALLLLQAQGYVAVPEVSSLSSKRWSTWAWWVIVRKGEIYKLPEVQVHPTTDEYRRIQTKATGDTR